MENYMKLELIGRGSGGSKVYRVKDLNTNQVYAMKKIILDRNDLKEKEKCENEIEIFKKLTHTNLIRYIDSFMHKDKLCIVMENASKGDLSKVIDEYMQKKDHIPEDIIWKYFIQICRALNYMHSKKILHRDIKCQNIFLNSNNVIKVGDFGISKILKTTQELCKTQLGTPFFLSPEICYGKPYSYKSDLWMLGCVLYELLTFSKPFIGHNLPELMLNIIHNDIVDSNFPKIYSKDIKSLVKRLLIKDSKQRITLKEIMELPIYKEKNKKLLQLANNSKEYETNNDENDDIIYPDEYYEDDLENTNNISDNNAISTNDTNSNETHKNSNNNTIIKNNNITNKNGLPKINSIKKPENLLCVDTVINEADEEYKANTPINKVKVISYNMPKYGLNGSNINYNEEEKQNNNCEYIPNKKKNKRTASCGVINMPLNKNSSNDNNNNIFQKLSTLNKDNNYKGLYNMPSVNQDLAVKSRLIKKHIRHNSMMECKTNEKHIGVSKTVRNQSNIYSNKINIKISILSSSQNKTYVKSSPLLGGNPKTRNAKLSKITPKQRNFILETEESSDIF